MELIEKSKIFSTLNHIPYPTFPHPLKKPKPQKPQNKTKNLFCQNLFLDYKARRNHCGHLVWHRPLDTSELILLKLKFIFQKNNQMGFKNI